MGYLVSMRPSLNDENDWQAENFLENEEFPETLDYRGVLPPIRDQGEQGSCAAQTAACMKEFQEYFDNDITEHFSPQFVYDNRFNQESNGMTCRDVMKILNKKGCPLEKSYPYNYISDPKDIDEEVFEEASKFKIKSYARVNTVDDCKKALAKNGPCLIAFPVYNYGMYIWRSRTVRQAMRGGHAMAIVGYTKDSFIIRNSWGSDWGDKGYTYYGFDEWGMHFDCWTTIDENFKINKNIINDDIEGSSDNDTSDEEPSDDEPSEEDQSYEPSEEDQSYEPSEEDQSNEPSEEDQSYEPSEDQSKQPIDCLKFLKSLFSRN